MTSTILLRCIHAIAMELLLFGRPLYDLHGIRDTSPVGEKFCGALFVSLAAGVVLTKELLHLRYLLFCITNCAALVILILIQKS